MKDYLKLMFKWHFLDWEKIWYYKHSLEISITKNLTTWKIAIKLSNFKMPSLKSPNMYLESCDSFVHRTWYHLPSAKIEYEVHVFAKNDWPIFHHQPKYWKKRKYFLSLLATHETILYHTNIVLHPLLPRQTAFPPHRNSVQAVPAKFGTNSFAKVQSCYIVQPRENKHDKEKAPT